ncbi:hypothetical protein FACS1894186_2050 [Alphaproteobacteria bacterium]|nr:hypothetical protein FACS1894186_2050 [Alphaproteobacteria bacterium]
MAKLAWYLCGADNMVHIPDWRPTDKRAADYRAALGDEGSLDAGAVLLTIPSRPGAQDVVNDWHWRAVPLEARESGGDWRVFDDARAGIGQALEAMRARPVGRVLADLFASEGGRLCVYYGSPPLHGSPHAMSEASVGAAAGFYQHALNMIAYNARAKSPPSAILAHEFWHRADRMADDRVLSESDSFRVGLAGDFSRLRAAGLVDRNWRLADRFISEAYGDGEFYSEMFARLGVEYMNRPDLLRACSPGLAAVFDAAVWAAKARLLDCPELFADIMRMTFDSSVGGAVEAAAAGVAWNKEAEPRKRRLFSFRKPPARWFRGLAPQDAESPEPSAAPVAMAGQYREACRKRVLELARTHGLGAGGCKSRRLRYAVETARRELDDAAASQALPDQEFYAQALAASGRRPAPRIPPRSKEESVRTRKKPAV